MQKCMLCSPFVYAFLTEWAMNAKETEQHYHNKPGGEEEAMHSEAQRACPFFLVFKGNSVFKPGS